MWLNPCAALLLVYTIEERQCGDQGRSGPLYQGERGPDPFDTDVMPVGDLGFDQGVPCERR